MTRFGIVLASIALSLLIQSPDSADRLVPGREELASAAYKVLAVESGKLRFKGLLAPVEVLRDRWGVAHIYAQNQHDLFFAQGVVASQDRLFQMELWKRAGQGRLAEILGPGFLPRDVNARALQYRGNRQAEFESYSPDTLAILTAFTDGINAYLASLTAVGGQGLPIEFALAGFVPDRWHPEDCLNRMAAFSMTGNALSELEHARALAAFGAQKAGKLFGFDPPVTLDPAPGEDFSGLSPDLLKNLVGSDVRIEFPGRAREESNNWTISGALTASGRPLLANDPHRVVGLPSLRYIVHLVAPGWNVIGAGEPGLPGVALGHNEHIAWGFTIFGLDQQDLYLEELNPANPSQYRTENGWKDLEVRRELFHVKGAADAEIDLEFSRHGPVLWQDGSRALALRWVGSEPGTAGYLGSLAIDRANNWQAFEAAVPRWKVPSENLVYADTEGNIGEHSAGLAPIRKWTGLLPVPGAGRYEWTGFVPTMELPHFFDPKEGFVATANHKIIAERYPYNVGFEWAPPFRVTRIRTVIEGAKESGHKLDLADMQALQNDVVSLAAVEFRTIVAGSSLKEDASLRDFLRWNGAMTRESAEAALYEVWFRQAGLALADRFAKASGTGLLKSNSRYQDLGPEVVLHVLANPNREWFGENAMADRDQLLRDKLANARAELTKLLGPEPSGWNWGKLHTIRFRHALDRLPGAEALLDLGLLARPGDDETVNATGMNSDSWQQVSGASYREIIDTSDWDRSVAVNTPGQSGQPGSLHYSDLMPLWDAGKYFPLAYSRKAVEEQTTDRLRLEPWGTPNSVDTGSRMSFEGFSDGGIE
jgi:penicillin G amidase